MLNIMLQLTRDDDVADGAGGAGGAGGTGGVGRVSGVVTGCGI